MINFIIFIQQISKSVLPYKNNIVLNHPCIRVFRCTACISIIVLFVFKNQLCPYFTYILLFISYNYIFYQCVVITLKLYYINKSITRSSEYLYIPLKYFKITYNVFVLFIVLYGLPIIGDTIIEITGDVKYVIKQILLKRK